MAGIWPAIVFLNSRILLEDCWHTACVGRMLVKLIVADIHLLQKDLKGGLTGFRGVQDVTWSYTWTRIGWSSKSSLQ